MGNSESRITDDEIHKCIDSIEDELLTGGYEEGVTPESVVVCLRTMFMVAKNDGGNVVVPKAMNVRYERDVVVSCVPQARSRYSGSITMSARGYHRAKRTPSGSAYARSVVESATGTISASEARKIRMQKRAESRVSPRTQRRSQAEPPSRSSSVNGRPPPRPESIASVEDAMEQLAGLNIRRAPPVSLNMPPANDAPVFRGPPTQRGVTGSVRGRAAAMEGRI